MLGLNLIEALARVAGRRDDPTGLAAVDLASSDDARNALNARDLHAVVATEQNMTLKGSATVSTQRYR